MASRDNQLTEDQAQLAAGRDLANWATAVRRLQVSQVPDGVDNINVDGRRVVGVIQGFGQLWRKTYRIRLDGAAVTPAEVIAVWKQRFASFWPADSRFHSPEPAWCGGLVGPAAARPPASVQRGHDPVRRCGVVHGHDCPRASACRLEHLQRLRRRRGHGRRGAGPHARRRPAVRAGHDGVCSPDGGPPVAADPPQPGRLLWSPGPGQVSESALDRRRQWSKAGNLWYNAAVRSALHTLAAQLRPHRPTSTPTRHR